MTSTIYTLGGKVLVSGGGTIWGTTTGGGGGGGNRTNFTGHYATVSHNQQGLSGFGASTWATETIGGVNIWRPNLVGIQFRIPWVLMETAKNTYDFSLLDSYLGICAAKTGGSGASGHYQVIVMIEDKSFTTNVNDFSGKYYPGYLETEGYTSALGNPAGAKPGYNTYRWDPYVSSRYNLMTTAMAAYRGPNTPNGFDGHPNFEGISIQETAIGLNGTVEASAPTPYTAVRYATAYKSMIGNINTKFPKSRCFWYFNFIDVDQTQIGTVLDYIVASADGACGGGPDCLHNNASLNNVAYHYYTDYKSTVTLFTSMQNDEYSETNPDGSGNYTMTQQFNLAASKAGEVTIVNKDGVTWSLFSKRVFWDLHEAGGGNDWSDAASVIAANGSYNALSVIKS